VSLNPGAWIDGLRKIDRLLTLEENHGKILQKQADVIDKLAVRLTELEAHVKAREEILVAEAKGASAAVASATASQHVAALAQSIGRIEARMEGLQGRLLPPQGNA
jgi:hypothetical protein